MGKTEPDLICRRNLDELRRLLVPVSPEVHKLYELVVRQQIKIDQLVMATPGLAQHPWGASPEDLSYLSLRDEKGEVIPWKAWIPPSLFTMSSTDRTHSTPPPEDSNFPARVSPGTLVPQTSPNLVELKPLRLPPPYLGASALGADFKALAISEGQDEAACKVHAPPADQQRFIESVIQGKAYDKMYVRSGEAGKLPLFPLLLRLTPSFSAAQF
jgi:hypothetical protein